MIAKVIVDISNSEVDRIFDYECDSIEVGTRVLVPFSNREIEGYVIDTADQSQIEQSKLKRIIRTLDDIPVISHEMLKLMEFMVEKYHLKRVDALRLFLPSKMRGGRVKELLKNYAFVNEQYINKNIGDFIKPSAKAQAEIFEYVLQNKVVSTSEINEKFSAAALRNLITRNILGVEQRQVRRVPYNNIILDTKSEFQLTLEQQQVFEQIQNETEKPVLIQGVTGSGKTEIYMRCIDKALQESKSAIMLVPEISLTPQVMKSFRSRFGDEVALLHSGLNEGQRYDEWRRILLGQARVIVGARSAIFAPVKDIGLIIIDEEHDSSYISSSNPRYFTHEIAFFRKSYNNSKLILGSATPSVESYHKAMTSVYKPVYLKKRVNMRPMPEIAIVNMCNELMRGNNSMFSARLESELEDCINEGNQALIFINRRGYSSYVMCKACGYVAKCENCDVSLVYHKAENTLKCHFCQNRYAALDICPNCKSAHIKQGYIGTQKVAEYLQSKFSNETVLRMDNDTTSTKDSHFEILEAFAQKKSKILVGTQMIAKGHDFPDVTLVGIMDADMSLYFSDYRSIERTYQLITQVSGRAGRDEKPGRVILQTYSPNHYVYRYAINNDYEGFYNKEINILQVTRFPPFSKILRILITSQVEQLAMDSAQKIFIDLKELSEQNEGAFIYLNAMRSPKKRLLNKFRLQVLIRLTNDRDDIIGKIYDITDKYRHQNVTCFTEINPVDLS